MNRHIWDTPLTSVVRQRQAVMAIYCLFCVATGLIKISILLFYRRLSSRIVSPGILWAIRITIVCIAAYSIAFTLVIIFGCKPISGFWDQVDVLKQLQGYTYLCVDEGAFVVSAGVISSFQDLTTAILPTFLYWNLRIPIRQKIALFSIFAIGYGVVAIATMRTYYTWVIFYDSYDITWVFWNIGLTVLLELHIGMICGNAPALKVLFSHFLKSDLVSQSGYRSGSSPSSNPFKRSWKTPGNTNSSTLSKLSTWRQHRNRTSQGYLSDHRHTDITIDEHGGLHQNGQIRKTQVIRVQSGDAQEIQGYAFDVELGNWRTVPGESFQGGNAIPQLPAQSYRSLSLSRSGGSKRDINRI
jgi:hypothetical protein